MKRYRILIGICLVPFLLAMSFNNYQDFIPKFQEKAVAKNLLTNQTKWDIIHTIWANKKDILIHTVNNGLEHKSTLPLYNMQIQVNNLLIAAAEAKKTTILDEIAQVSMIAYDYLQLKDHYVYYNLPGEGRTSIRPLSVPVRMWVNQDEQESILDSAQFLYLAVKAVNLYLDIDEQNRTSNMNVMIKSYPAIALRDHYLRWIFSEQGMFQVRGWGCDPGTFNHYEFLYKKLGRKFKSQTKNNISYCNVVTDTDMWIVAGVVELLSANHKNPQLVPIENRDKERLIQYINVASELLQSRLTRSSLLNFTGQAVGGLNFDLGSWDKHSDMAYSVYRGVDFPVFESNQAAENIGWDVSHAKRFVNVFNTLYKNRHVTGQQFPDKDVMIGLTNQLIYGVFNKDFAKPLFSNYMDGTNGWYRVDYSGRRGFGYAPYDMSIAVATGGYGFWSEYNTDMNIVMNAIWSLFTSEDPEFVEHRRRYYDTTHYNNYKRTGEPINFETSWPMLNFLCAYRIEKSY